MLKLANEMSSSTGELEAIKLSLDNSPPIKYVNIFLCIDSLSSLKPLQNMYSTQPLITYIHKKRYNIPNKITMYWFPGHEDIQQSVEVDRFAKLETQTHMMSYQDLQNEASSTILRKWQRT